MLSAKELRVWAMGIIVLAWVLLGGMIADQFGPPLATGRF
jgi:hypothetical protein